MMILFDLTWFGPKILDWWFESEAPLTAICINIWAPELDLQAPGKNASDQYG